MTGIIHKKITSQNIFDCENLQPFIETITQILSFSGASKSAFYVCEKDNVQFLTKLCVYLLSPYELYTPEENQDRKLLHSADAEIEILKVLRDEIILTGKSPCIVELIYHHTCETIAAITPPKLVCTRINTTNAGTTSAEDSVNGFVCMVADLARNKLARDALCFIVMERCTITIDAFMRTMYNNPINIAVFKSLLFQVIHALCVIRETFPGFRHHDLHADNTLLKFDSSYKFSLPTRYLVFGFKNRKFTIPYFGIWTKIIDFGFSSIPERGLVSVWTKDKTVMYSRSENDLLFLYRHIYYRMGSYPQINKLLTTLDPTRSFVNYYTENIREISADIPSPEDMLMSSAFKEYYSNEVPIEQVYAQYNITPTI